MFFGALRFICLLSLCGLASNIVQVCAVTTGVHGLSLLLCEFYYVIILNMGAFACQLNVLPYDGLVIATC